MLVIYKELGSFKMTSQDNYNARIQNARGIIDLSEFEDSNQIIEYFVKYENAQSSDFIVKE